MPPMTCQHTPSLCTASAKGDTNTVEKHLKSGCCNPYATQYFINPDEDAHSPAAIVGFLRRKRTVIVAPKNTGENTAHVKPATPLQVALYYREEGVLFLLLNHFLKISNGNVSRCYDETAEAIATSNGYSHLMDFFQYYDNINLETFGSCWTEAMRHICDLTTKVIKYRRQATELIQDRDHSHQARDYDIKERMSMYKGMMEQKDALIQRLQQQLREKDAIIENHHKETSTMRDTLDGITGGPALEILQRMHWEARSSSNSASGVELVSLPPPFKSTEANDPSDHDEPSVDATTLVLSECMRHHLGLMRRLQCLRDYVVQCKDMNELHRSRSANLVDNVDSLCTWNAVDTKAPDLSSECELQLGPDDLCIFDCGNESQTVTNIIEQLEDIAEKNTCPTFNAVAHQQGLTVCHIRDLLQEHDIANESSVRTLTDLMEHFRQIFTSQSLGTALAEAEARRASMESRIQQSIAIKAKCEESGSVPAVEKETIRCMDLQRRLLEIIKEKLEILQANETDLRSLSSVEALSEQALDTVQETMATREQLKANCRADWESLQLSMKTRSPQMEHLQVEAAAVAEAFSQALIANNTAQTERWDVIEAAFGELLELQQAQADSVQAQLEAQMELKRKEKDHERFVGAARQHCDRLVAVGNKCEVSAEVGKAVMETIQFGASKLHDWFRDSQAELAASTLATHKEMYTHFRDWFLTQGEYTHKKKMLLNDIKRKVAETENRKQLALQRLDASVEQHTELLKHLEQQRKELEELHIPRLEASTKAALKLFEVTQEFLTQQGIPFTHPAADLRERNDKRELEIHMREVSKYQELLLASQKSLLECSNTLPEMERLLLVENHNKIADGKLKLEAVSRDCDTASGGSHSSRGSQPVVIDAPALSAASELEDNRRLKQQLQEYFVMIPLDFLDPITLEIIADPVTAADGHTYERTSIQRWLQNKGKSPKTGEVLTELTLTPNDDVRRDIQNWKAQQKMFLLEQQNFPEEVVYEPTGSSFVGRPSSAGNEGAEPPVMVYDLTTPDE
uniref:U-box domain-containing protein n=1 Tax=Eutreptiella gymnastica TaxID=73025 RepID=A0A7S1JBV2_9EUGL|mmetsp:Transcript_81551/g.143800  ORF Transcript_81551/g.143800 Transcript_81551/m.143800 type:complete len:1030 (+) Transcript_81551:29-3118(+)